jgi:DNA repair protein RAD5
MDLTDLTPEEVQWLQKENVIPQDVQIPQIPLKAKEKRGLDSNVSQVATDSPVRGKRPKKERLLIGECGVTAMARAKGRNALQFGDGVVLVRSKPTWTPKKSFGRNATPKDNIVWIRNERTGSEIGKLPIETSAFISTLIDLEICEFEVEVIYCPEILNISDEILLNLRIYLKATAFNQKLGTQLESNEQVLYRKKALIKLFHRTGLLTEEDVSETKVASGDPEAITASDLSRIYSKANLIDQNLSTLEPREGMSVQLRNYQKVALSFMVKKEQLDLETKGMSPLWKRFSSVDGTPFYYSPYSGELTMDFPVEHHCRGGILADEMGLGKTIEILSLIHTNPLMDRKHKLETSATLIVCPLNLASQWIEEAARCFGSNFQSFFFYGDHRPQLSGHSKFNMVVTTYGTIMSEFDNANESPLYNIHWHRVVLDEAHMIKDRSTKTAKAVYALNSTNRWAVTGTPIVNKLEDLFSLIHFLKVEPWCQFSFWNSFVTTPFAKRDPKALEVVQTILEPLIIRRTKDQKDINGNSIVSLPPKTVTIQTLEFSEDEQKLYDSMNSFSRKKLDYLRLVGKADYLHVFSLILRLRQLCNHRYLINARESEGSLFSKDLEALMKDHGGDVQFKQQVASELQENSERDCPVILAEVDLL